MRIEVLTERRELEMEGSGDCEERFRLGTLYGWEHDELGDTTEKAGGIVGEDSVRKEV